MLWKVMAHTPVVVHTCVGSSRVTRFFAGLYEYDRLSTVQPRSTIAKGESLFVYLVRGVQPWLNNLVRDTYSRYLYHVEK